MGGAYFCFCVGGGDWVYCRCAKISKNDQRAPLGLATHAPVVFYYEVGNHFKGRGFAAWHQTRNCAPLSFPLTMETHTPLDDLDLALVTKARAAELLSASVRTVERLVESGDLQRIVLRPKAVRITTASLQKLIQPTTTPKKDK